MPLGAYKCLFDSCLPPLLGYAFKLATFGANPPFSLITTYMRYKSSTHVKAPVESKAAVS